MHRTRLFCLFLFLSFFLLLVFVLRILRRIAFLDDMHEPCLGFTTIGGYNTFSCIFRYHLYVLVTTLLLVRFQRKEGDATKLETLCI